MLHKLLELSLTAISVMIVSALLPGMRVRGFVDALLFALVTGFLNVLAWHTLAAVFSVVFSIATLGVGIVIINGLIFLVAQKLVRGVEIDGCLIAALASFLVSVVNSAILHFLR
jgi:putative membrane protein